MSQQVLERSNASGSPAVETGPKPRTATDLVPLGKDGPPICRLGMGTGSDGGAVQRALGTEGFNRLVRYGFERGITFIDTADLYQTHTFVRDAIKGLPREDLWIQTKMAWDAPSPPERPLEVLERFLRELGTDYVDSLLIHCATIADWDVKLRPMMDAFAEAKARGLSVCTASPATVCLPCAARRTAVWIDVQLARVNPQGRHIDGVDGSWDEPAMVPEAMKEIAEMHAQGRGVIGMKMIGGGHFAEPDDRERALQFVMNCGFVDSVVIGFAAPAEIDEAIERIDRGLGIRD